MIYSDIFMKRVFNKNDFTVVRAQKGAGLGLITRRPFKKGDFVIEYTGPIITTEQANEKGGKYLFDINSKWTIDGVSRSNLARYINHSCKPNCEADVSGKKVFIYALRKIKEGEELNYDYGEEYFDEYIKPHKCKCVDCLLGKKKRPK
ncbi:MAG TPA: SET domain-containing protein [Candidatus Kaiserbacteria bacterium]|nr:SET domain-containing protein [Candidatus Kaiserbacteria bacterium]